MVDLDVAAFAVYVPRRADLAGQADEREILPIEIGGEDEIVARRLGDVVETAVGVLSSRQKAARLYWKRLLSRLPNSRMPSWLSLNRKPRKSLWNGWMPTRIEWKS